MEPSRLSGTEVQRICAAVCILSRDGERRHAAHFLFDLLMYLKRQGTPSVPLPRRIAESFGGAHRNNYRRRIHFAEHVGLIELDDLLEGGGGKRGVVRRVRPLVSFDSDGLFATFEEFASVYRMFQRKVVTRRAAARRSEQAAQVEVRRSARRLPRPLSASGAIFLRGNPR